MKRLLTAIWICFAMAVYAEDVTRNQTFTSAIDDNVVVNLINTGVYNHRLTWTGSGTRTECAIKLLQSEDGVTWTDLISTQYCNANSSATTTGNVNYIRMSVTKITGSGNTVYARYDGTPAAGAVTIDTSALALEAGGNLAAIKTSTDKIPALGQAAAGGSVPVILPSATITTLTPPAAITGFATETSLAKLTVAPGTAIGSNTFTMTGGSVTTGAPTYTTGQINPFSLNVKGGLRVTLMDGAGAETGLTAAPLAVALPAATVTTLTPPAAITGFATSAKQPALGTAGTASTDVITVQGIGSMTPMLVTGTGTAGSAATGVVTVQGIASGVAQPISAAALPLPSGAATAALQGAGLPAVLAGDGGLKVTSATTDAAVDSAVTTTPVQTGGIFETTPTVIETGDAAVLHFDANQALLVTSPIADAADGAAPTNPPLPITGRARATEVTAVDAGDSLTLTESLVGGALVHVGALPQQRWQATGGATPLADTTAISVRTHTDGMFTVVTSLLITNSDATVGTVVSITSGTGTVCGTGNAVLWSGYAAALGGGFAISNPEGLFSTPAAADDLCIINTTTSAEVIWSASGFKTALDRVE